MSDNLKRQSSTVTEIISIIYPIFLEVFLLSDDDYWKHLIKDLAFNNTPYGLYIDADTQTICSILKGREFHFCFMDRTDVEVLYTELYDYFHNKVGIFSSKEYKENKNINVKYNSWVSIKKKMVKDLLIQNYVIELKHKYDLTLHQSKLLLSNIMLWFQFKLIKPTDIVYDSDNCKILQIQDLYISKSGRIHLNREFNQLLST